LTSSSSQTKASKNPTTSLISGVLAQEIVEDLEAALEQLRGFRAFLSIPQLSFCISTTITKNVLFDKFTETRDNRGHRVNVELQDFRSNATTKDRCAGGGQRWP